MKSFFQSERGFALALTLLFMPVFIGVGLLVIDIGRGNNAQADHQAAADALALAGARELDGTNGARQRAQSAMANMSNQVSFLGTGSSGVVTTLKYQVGATGPFTVIFLRAIPGSKIAGTNTVVPGSDDTRITQQFVNDYIARSDSEAVYVFVQSRAQDLRSFFFNPVTNANSTVSIGATAVATLKSSTCDLAPFFICNPFESKTQFVELYDTGQLYGRLLKLSVYTGGGADKATSGNIGFLRMDGPGAEDVAAALAGKPYNRCVDRTSTVATQTGTITSAWVGYNTRFDMYSNVFGGEFDADGSYLPARITRKGYKPKSAGQACPMESPYKGKTPTPLELTEHYANYPVYSDDQSVFTYTPAGGGSKTVSFMGNGVWNYWSSVTTPSGVTFAGYWQTVYGSATDMSTAARRAEVIKTLPNENSVASLPIPSRYDTYRYEIEAVPKLNPVDIPGVVDEPAGPVCYKTPSAAETAPKDRRTMLVAVVDCATNTIKGQEPAVPVDLYAEVFLVRPVDEESPAAKTLDVEFVGVSEGVSNDPVEKYFRTEAILVR